jgi:hypothetical protein
LEQPSDGFVAAFQQPQKKLLSFSCGARSLRIR